MTVAERLRRLRGVEESQESFAARVGISRAALANYETGRTVPGPSVRRRICDALGVPPGELDDDTSADEAIAELRARFGVPHDAALATKLGIDKSTVYWWRARGRVPARYMRPDLPLPSPAAVPAGWVLVPVEPDLAMFRALVASMPDLAGWALGSFREDYQAMLAAAPRPTVSEG